MIHVYHYITESTKRTAVGLLVLVALAFVGMRVASAATSYDVTNSPQMFLYESIQASTTSNIRLAALNRNGSTVTFANASGGVLRFRSGTKVEDVAYTSATINQTTKIVTLVGVTRDVCWNMFFVLQGCGGAQSFPKGTLVELSVDARLLNKKANTDRSNIFTFLQTFGSGAKLTGTRYPLKLNEFTTAQRNALTPEEGMMLKNSTTGTNQQYSGGAWSDIAAGGVVNAGFNAAGKVQAGTITSLIARSGTGSTGALNVITPTHVTMTGGVQFKGFVAQVATGGVLDVRIGGTGIPSLTSGSLLVGQGASAMKGISAGTAGTGTGNTVFSNGRGLTVDRPYGCQLLYTQTADSATVGTSSTTEANLSKSYSIASGSYVVGDTWKVKAFLDSFGVSGATGYYRIKLGTNTLLANALDAGGADHFFDMSFTVRSLGNTGSVLVTGRDYDAADSIILPINGQAYTKGINTALTAALQTSFEADTNSANFSVRQRYMTVERCRPMTTN